jgi:hypothetical protein
VSSSLTSSSSPRDPTYPSSAAADRDAAGPPAGPAVVVGDRELHPGWGALRIRLFDELGDQLAEFVPSGNPEKACSWSFFSRFDDSRSSCPRRLTR